MSNSRACGHAFASSGHVTTLPICPRTPRRKAVWGPKRVLAAATLIVSLGSATTNAMAEGNHRQAGQKAQAGQANSQVKDYKLDGELTHRSTASTMSFGKTRVIVEL